MGQDLCQRYKMPNDVSTAVLVVEDEDVAYKNSESVLRLALRLTFPYHILGALGLLVPLFIRDAGYRAFARNRGNIWKAVKRVTGMGETNLALYRNRILGVKDDRTAPDSWGLVEKKNI